MSTTEANLIYFATADIAACQNVCREKAYRVTWVWFSPFVKQLLDSAVILITD